MTVSNSGNKEVYTGNGSTADFSFPHYFFANGDLEVYRTALDGTITLLTLTTDYTVTGAGNPAGGSVHMIVIPETGIKITIVRVVALTQTSDFVPNDSLPAEVLEQGLDRAIMGIQQVSEKIGRSILLPISSTLSGLSLPEPDAGKSLKWNATEDGLENTVASADDAAASAAAALISQNAAAVSASAALTSENNADASELLASQWASQTSGIVASTDFSAKAWAIGGTNVTDTSGRGAAKEWAVKITGTIDTLEYSSKAYAIGGTGVTNTSGRGAAKEWATKTSGTVDTTEFSSKEYAIGSQASTGGSSKGWSNTAHNVTVPGTVGGPTDYSAMHWAIEAMGIVGAADGVAKVTTNDTTASVLNNKIVVVGMTKTTLNPGGNEQLQLTAITKIKQVVSASLAGDNGFSLTGAGSTTYTDTGLSATITPTSTSNKILVLVSVGSNYVTNGVAGTGKFRILRGASSIEGAAGTKEIVVGGSNLTNQEFNTSFFRMIPDAPATTSATTYKLQAKTSNTGHTIKISEFSDSFIVLVEYEP